MVATFRENKVWTVQSHDHLLLLLATIDEDSAFYCAEIEAGKHGCAHVIRWREDQEDAHILVLDGGERKWT